VGSEERRIVDGVLGEAVAPRLKALAFRKAGPRSWIYRSGAVAQSVRGLGSRMGDRFTIELGLWYADIDPPMEGTSPAYFPRRERIGHVIGRDDLWWQLLSDEDVPALTKRVGEAWSLAEPWLMACREPRGLAEWHERNGWQIPAGRIYLALGDMERARRLADGDLARLSE
jgi:hypothetical protein